MFINQTKAMSKILGFYRFRCIIYKPTFHSALFTTKLCGVYGGVLINETIFHLTYGGPPKCLYNQNLTLFVCENGD